MEGEEEIRNELKNIEKIITEKDFKNSKGKYSHLIESYLQGSLEDKSILQIVSLIDNQLRRRFKTQLIYHSVCGSVSFNLRTGSSDFDFFG